MKEQIKKKKRKYPNQSIYLQYIYIYIIRVKKQYSNETHLTIIKQERNTT